jgi:hypothetical protein
MLRQKRRRIQRSWEKIKCFTICTDKISLAEIPYTAVECDIKISNDMLFRFNLSMFKRWCFFPIVVVDGFFVQGLYYNIGVASDWWLDEYFGDDDFEGFRCYCCGFKLCFSRK